MDRVGSVTKDNLSRGAFVLPGTDASWELLELVAMECARFV
jgi:hypothetical protein